MQSSANRLLLAENIFHETVDLVEPTRTAVLLARCGTDTALMEELRELLRACEAEQIHQIASTNAGEVITNRRIGNYSILRLLGRGGMGAVYLADRADGQFNQQVAVKIIDLPLATDLFRNRFRTERQILAGLTHPYIARLLDGGVSESGELYLVMEYIDGVSITHYATQQDLTIPQRLELFCKVCEAVQFAHQNLVVHRDLKPDNILVDPAGIPHLLDFGTAKILIAEPTPEETAQDLTRQGMQTFTPRYASPEQVLGRPITVASDTYSLGVLLYLLLTGVHPYELSEFSIEEMVRVIVNETPPRPSALAPTLDADLDSIILKALRKDPADRYTTVEQLSADVQAYIENRPVTARRGSLKYLTTKFIRRNKLAIAAAALLLITVLAGIGGILWQSHIANQQRRKAEARSADLRQLSNSLLSELDEALKDIPGSTGAQKLLVTRVLEHLDRMQKDALGDRQTALDLIGAYTRLGNVQGNLYYQNVADTPGALVSFNKAIALAEPLAKTYPRDPSVLRAHAAALEARGEAISDMGNAQESVDSLQAAVQIYDRAVQLPGIKPDLIFEAAIANETLGNELAEDSGMADPVAATVAYQHALDKDYQALRLDPNYMAVRRGLAVMHLHIGNVVLETNPTEAYKEFQTAIQLQSQLPDEQKKRAAQVRLRAQLLRKLAYAYVELGSYSQADPIFAQAAAIYQQLADADVKNVTALGDLQRLYENEAAAYGYAADPVLAERPPLQPAERTRNLQRKAQALDLEASTIRKIIQLSPSHEPWKAQLASVLVSLSATRAALHQSTDNTADTTASLVLLSSSADSKQASANDMDRTTSAYLEVQPTSLRDPARALGWAEQGVRLTHQKAPGYFLLLAQAYRANNQPSQAIQAAQQGLTLLPQPPPGTSTPRIKKQLEAETHPSY